MTYLINAELTFTVAVTIDALSEEEAQMEFQKNCFYAPMKIYGIPKDAEIKSTVKLLEPTKLKSESWQ